jgi:hypothetical protein
LTIPDFRIKSKFMGHGNELKVAKKATLIVVSLMDFLGEFDMCGNAKPVKKDSKTGGTREKTK